MPYIHDDFLLSNDAARRLYHEYAAGQPIIDYHSHLPPADVATNRQFRNLYEIWLEGDHYKWRAMRANGEDEQFCLGDAAPYDKYMAWSRTVPKTLRNPLYQWSHLELKRYFGIDELFNEQTAPGIWEQTEHLLAQPENSACGILERFQVAVACTTDDPADPLDHHQAIAASGLKTRVYPTFRPDKAMAVHQPVVFVPWLERLGTICNREMSTLDDLLDGIRQRHAEFHAVGCRLSDHGLPYCYAVDCDEATARSIFLRSREGVAASPDEQEQFGSFLMHYFGQLDAAAGWTKQLHLGPLRNNNSRRLAEYGPDGGFDSIGDWRQAEAMSRYFDRLDREGALPKVVVYNNNPSDNFVLATMIGNFQDGTVPGKMQFGSGWWHLDQKEGMIWQLNTLSNVGLLSRFVGMLTDSRSFLSFTRHEYFRRVLCDLLGREMESGELPPDDALVGEMVRDICFENARRYFGFELAT
ncbi:MAG: glucuronate isomerase [Planctomycetales bacterium]|nr:glucuronate isomerase [Planctomycetales bacterium]